MQEDFQVVFNKALKIVSISPQFEKPLFLKLKRYGYDEDIIKEVILKLKELNYINDYEYAKSYAKMLFEKKGYSESFVFNRLIQKGVDKDIVSDVIKSLNRDINKDEILLKFIKKNRSKFKKYLENNKERDIINTFYRYGFQLENFDEVLSLTKKIVEE
ncbi:MAG TPA: RecX family transcriptional regulator [Spirochaetota bacterium]|nr:RecX family transcriptional regulator [Spirochaetota bacterium]HOL55996.1 RecX family transcriptional regulator [Spirochaetota bacterium]HPP03438.1 RecX family transcriptional regulator [Spirochaetota bacterium]